MYTKVQFTEYMDEIRKEVCSRCIERPQGGPPCAPLGKRCGVEVNLPQIIDAVHAKYSKRMEPYTNKFHEVACAQCPNLNKEQCPCPMEYLLILAVQAIEAVDERHAMVAAGC
jgi:hypothetical protein